MSTPSNLVPEPPPTCNGREKSSETVPSPSVSKIPLPKCLVESPVRSTARSRTELRDKNLAGWDPGQENGLTCPLYSKSEPRTLFTAARMRGHGDFAAQAALTPITVNTFSAIDGAGSMTDRTAHHNAPASHEQPTSAFVSGPSSARCMNRCRHGGEMLSPEELPSSYERGEPVESQGLSTSGILAGDSTFIKISSNGSYLENDADHCAMNSCHSIDEQRRTASAASMELEDVPLGSSGTESADQVSTNQDLFDASLLAEEDPDLVTIQSLDANMTAALFSHDELHHFEDATEAENLYIVHNCREDQRQASFPLHSLEERLEDHMQRDIEDEISKEIQHLSQKLANLQARHGAQRMSDGSTPSVLSCPVTPVLTPRIRSLKKADSCSKREEGGRQQRGRVVAAKIFRGITGEKPHQSRGQGCAVRKESLERRCSSSNSNARCAPSYESGEQYYGEESLAGTPSSGSIRRHVTDSTHNNKPRAGKLQAGVTSPQVFPDNNRRFEWVKTLRSGETGNIRSKQLPSPGKNVLGEDLVCLDSVKKKRVALLADMTRELETRLNELAVESAAHVQARNVGKVVASRYNQLPRREKRPEDYGSLDERTAVHLVKAGLTRGPAGKKLSQDSYSKSEVAKPEKKAEKIPKKKSVGIQHDPSDQPPVAQTFETEYAAFVEGPSDGPKTIPGVLDVKNGLQEQADPGKMAKISQGVSSAEEPRAVCKPVVGSRFRKRQPIKRTYIRCIEVVVDDQSLADRSASGAIKNLQPRIIPEPTEGEGSLSPNLGNAGATSNSNPHMTDASQLSVISLHEKAVRTEGSKSLKPRDLPLRSTVFKLHGKICQELGCVQADMSPGLSDLKVPAAEKPPLSTLRERWEELIDALEKERLTLPKIRTETGNVVATSPRDSGCVKRITERLNSTEQHFSPENLQGEEFINSCVEKESSCKETDTSATPTLRSLDGNRKGSALQVQTKPARRHWNGPQNHEQVAPQSDVESFDLDSFWCLVRESEDHVPTTSAHPPIAAVR